MTVPVITSAGQLPEEKPGYPDVPILVITPSKGWRALNLREIWQYRELLYFLTMRDVSIRYKQAALGLAWALLQPLFQIVVFTVIFGHLAKLPSDNMPYALFSLAAVLPWQLFAGSLTRGGVSLVSNANLITKVYFPRLIIPFLSVGACLVDFAISFVILIALFLWYNLTTPWHFTARWSLLLLPLFILLAILTSLAVSLWLAALNVQYRDIGHTIPFLVQIWMYASPVAYSASLIPAGPWRVVYGLNPMVGVIQGFRWALLGGHPPDALLAVSGSMVLILLLGGLYYFRAMERTFADVV